MENIGPHLEFSHLYICIDAPEQLRRFFISRRRILSLALIAGTGWNRLEQMYGMVIDEQYCVKWVSMLK